MTRITRDTQIFVAKVTGMHCANCELTIERKLREIPGVVGARANCRSGVAEVDHQGALGVSDVRQVLEQAGYGLDPSTEAASDATSVGRNTARDYVEISAIFAFVVGIVVLVQWLGVIPKGLTVSENSGYGLAFVIGRVASVTSCMAVTGGLLVAVAAKYADATRDMPAWRRFQPHLAFNLGRLVSYALLGGAIGALGAALTLSPEVTSALVIGQR